MKRLAFLLLILCPVLAHAGFFLGAVNGGGGGVAYTGFADQYAALTPTWGFSTYKLRNAYSGSFAVVQRASDSSTTNLGFNASNQADPSALATFCSGTACFATTIFDQINSNDATCSNVRIYVAANGLVAVAAGPSGTCSVPYSAVYSTAKQHLFAVAKPSYEDNRNVVPDLPTVTITANLTSGSATMTGMSSQANISTVSDFPHVNNFTGITDSANALTLPAGGTGSAYLGTFPTGSTATMLSADQNVAPATANASGDTITVTNAVRGGAWIVQGPASSTFYTSAYWGFSISDVPINLSDPSNATWAINAGNGSSYGDFGEGMRQTWGVWDFDTSTSTAFYNGLQLWASSAATNITYSTNVGLTLFSDASGAEVGQNQAFEQMVLFPATEATRATMAAWLETQFGVTLAPTGSQWTTSDGFTMKPEMLAPFPDNRTSAWGDYSFTDANGLIWNPQTYGYTWPSIAYATNINNGATMRRFIVEPGDFGAFSSSERAETNASNALVTPGQSLSQAYQLEFEQIPTQNGDWCFVGQDHYVSDASPPDIVVALCKGGQLQFIYQNGTSGSPNSVNCGSPIAIVAGRVYAVEIEVVWSSGGTTDSLSVHAGTNGGTLPLVCTASGSLWTHDTGGAYPKEGIYRGFPWANAGTVILRYMNMVWSNTANANAGWITSQPALPTHP